MIWAQGVDKGRISRQRFVELTSTKLAIISGIYPQKGSLAPGADADIVIFDPEYRGTISHADSYERTDYSTYEGFPRIGRFEKVFLRGQLMTENGKLVGEKGHGKYVEPKPYAMAYEGFIKDKK